MAKSKKNIFAVDQKDRIWNIFPSFKHWIYLAKTKEINDQKSITGSWIVWPNINWQRKPSLQSRISIDWTCCENMFWYICFSKWWCSNSTSSAFQCFSKLRNSKNWSNIVVQVKFRFSENTAWIKSQRPENWNF